LNKFRNLIYQSVPLIDDSLANLDAECWDSLRDRLGTISRNATEILTDRAEAFKLITQCCREMEMERLGKLNQWARDAHDAANREGKA
jgi:hypothetical protein